MARRKKIKIEKIPRGRPQWGRVSKRVLVVIEEELFEKVQKLAESEQVSRNSVIVHALKKFTEELK